MDDIKDNQRGDTFFRFIDSQQVRTDPFGKNRAAERLYRRVERICAALYLLTRHLPESEPLRIEIRSQAIALLEKVLHMKDEMRAQDSGAVVSFESSIRKLISFLRVLTAAGRISFANAETVIGALDELTVFVASSRRSQLSETIYLTREELVGDTSPLHDRQSLKDIKDTRKSLKDKTDILDTPSLSPSSRAQGVIAVLRGAGGLGIKDISARLPDYSEKMIQRELAALVRGGEVKKDGFKRWSRYTLAQQ